MVNVIILNPYTYTLQLFYDEASSYVLSTVYYVILCNNVIDIYTESGVYH